MAFKRNSIVFSLHNLFFAFVILLSSLTVQLQGSEMDGNIVFSVSHSFDSYPSPHYLPRGVVTVQSLKNLDISYRDTTPLTSTDYAKLKKLANENGIYRVKLSSTNSNHSATSFTTACSIYESGLSDILTVSLDSTGNLLGVSIQGILSQCTATAPPSDRSNFNTTIQLVQTVNGPVPDTQTYILRVEQEKSEKARGEHSDNRSFLAKYWMYIVPLVIFLLISGASQPEGGSAGAAR